MNQTNIRTREGFTAWVEENTRLLYAVSYAILQNGDLCADAVQSALVKAWNSMGRLRDMEKARAYILRIVQNESKSLLRKRRDLLLSDAAEPPAPATESEKQIDIRRAMQKLSETQRLIAMLYYFERCDTATIGRMLSMKPATVQSHLHRARATLKKELTDYAD